MMEAVSIVFSDGHEEVHFDSPIMPGEYTLCGHDTIGDYDWAMGVPTKKAPDCERCAAIIAACRDTALNPQEPEA